MTKPSPWPLLQAAAAAPAAQLGAVTIRVLSFGVRLSRQQRTAGGLEHLAQRLAGPLLSSLQPAQRRRLVLEQASRVGSPHADQVQFRLCLPAAEDPALLLHGLEPIATRCGVALCTSAEAAELHVADWRDAPCVDGNTLRIDLRTPWPLPCPLAELDAARLWPLLVQRLRDWGVVPPRWPPGAAAGRLLTHYARWQSAPGCRHGVLTGALFLLAPGAGWPGLLRALQPLHLPASVSEAGPLGWRGAFQVGPQRGGWLDLGLVSLRRLRRLAGADDDSADAPLPDPADPASWQGSAALAASLAIELRQARYHPRASQAVALHRPGKPPRWVERLGRRDALAQRHLLALLGPVCERAFHPSSYGFRRGLGRPEALRAVRDALAAGCTQVVETDIANCFDSIAHAQVWQAMDAVLLPEDRLLRGALQAMLRQPCGYDGTPRPRLAGLAQGAPLSPMLANLVLGAIDLAVQALPVRCVRYADDLVLLAHGKADARRALGVVRQAAVALGLQLAPDKTRIGHVQEGFTFLGERFSPQSVEPVQAATCAQRKPLVVTWPYLELGVNGPCLEARHAGKPIGRWPLRRLNALLVLAPAVMSTTLLERCAAHQVVVGLSLRGGRDMVVMPAEQRHHLERQARHLQWHGALSGGERLALAQVLVDAKVANAMALVRQRQPGDLLLDSLHEVRRQLPAAGNTNVLRGHEGHAAKLMFRWLNGQILPALRPVFGSARRARGAPDRLNSMLNLAYHLLRSRLSMLLRSRALNPYLGWLHDADDNYETLTYDLMEPFRPLVDRVVLRLVNRQELRAGHFDATPGAHRLTPEGASRLVQAFERALGERVGPHLWRDMLWVQVQAVAKLARGEGAFWVFHWQPRERQVRPQLPENGNMLLTLGSADDLDAGNDPALPWWPEPPGQPDTQVATPGATP